MEFDGGTSSAGAAAVNAVVPEAVKGRGRRPKPPEVNLQQSLGTRHLLEIVNLESDARITKVAIDGDTIVVGTSRGRIIGYDRTRFNGKIDTYGEHNGDPILDLWVKDKKAIVSLSKNRIYLKRFPGQDPADGIVEMLVNDGHNPRDMLCLTVIDN